MLERLVDRVGSRGRAPKIAASASEWARDHAVVHACSANWQSARRTPAEPHGKGTPQPSRPWDGKHSGNASVTRHQVQGLLAPFGHQAIDRGERRVRVCREPLAGRYGSPPRCGQRQRVRGQCPFAAGGYARCRRRGCACEPGVWVRDGLCTSLHRASHPPAAEG